MFASDLEQREARRIVRVLVSKKRGMKRERISELVKRSGGWVDLVASRGMGVGHRMARW